MRSGDQVARALGADTRVARISRGKLRFVTENAGQVGQLMHDDVGPGIDHGTLERARIENIDDHRPDARGLKLTRDVGRTRHADNVMTGLTQQRHQTPPDRTARSCEKNFHVFRP